ncbi:NADPH2:quinone reductase [Microbacteriaceae bacterium SG_E_30_P1]|uniref:NADPH2:quinone reductase n=1 Tax=Antiquaquibacter oligotrophicus TaxID=2880260 RepID=A0ABT6KJQ4_9MICO|nr:NADP-dependent oxidoreductase [Antiquaquibacter oligotrophicus]MDH6180232.1 NADPH2:quinone reductase [Antiquaquibacter oligotrophicus]UDF14021.1 NADP-dependent oxidoreductase [Antiquaquibacter oligotrophicus]
MTNGRAIIANSFGTPEVLELVELHVPEPGPGEVTILVHAAGVNPADIKKLAGQFGSPSLPMRFGSEVAGVVQAVGPDAVGPMGPIEVGHSVIAYPVSGGYADEITVKASSVLPMPEGLSWPEAANLLATGVTAWHLLEATGVGEGDRVLIHGASGGVGYTAAQLALLRGATVVGTASAANQTLLTDAGARAVVYGDGLADRVRAELPDGVDVALDTVGTDEALDVSVDLVSDRSRIATIAGFARGAELGVKMLGGGPGADPGRDIRTAARPELIALADEGKIDIVIARTFPLEAASEALELVRSGHPGGQVALRPNDH